MPHLLQGQTIWIQSWRWQQQQRTSYRWIQIRFSCWPCCFQPAQKSKKFFSDTKFMIYTTMMALWSSVNKNLCWLQPVAKRILKRNKRNCRRWIPTIYDWYMETWWGRWNKNEKSPPLTLIWRSPGPNRKNLPSTPTGNLDKPSNMWTKEVATKDPV